MTIVSTYSRSTGNLWVPTGTYGSMTSTRQKRPFVRAPFNSIRITGFGNFNLKGSVQNILLRGGANGEESACRGNAYLRLRDKALPRAAMAVNLAQGKQAWEMIASRSLQLVRAYKYLRRGNLPGFARELSLSPKLVRGRTTSKRARQDPQGAWLEFTFGWSPLITDIYNAVDVLQSDFPVIPVRGSAKTQYATRSVTSGRVLDSNFHTQCRLVADLRIKNPNLLLANQLGLLNPAAVVWDIIPFSFVVDWFLPIGRFISTFNDTAGLRYDNPCTTIRTLYQEDTIRSNGQRGQAFGRKVERLTSNFMKPGFPTKLKLPTASMWLAATSVALLMQVFGGKK